MAKVQKQFDDFNDAILLRRFVENAILREKRDIIREKLDEWLPAVFEAHGEICPDFSFRNQGSYEMGTGVKPLNGDYDIDQGIYFKVSTKDFPDPVVLKQRVHEALDGHTKDVCIRRSCVTVFYQRKDEYIYHVDIAVYVDSPDNPNGKPHVAKGKENSGTELRLWEISDPQALIDTLEARFDGATHAQFRRVIRYLKRWKDVNFSSDGNAAPLGIGLTVAVYNDLQGTFFNGLTDQPDDLGALAKLIQSMLNRFVWQADADNNLKPKLVVSLPIEPYNDLFEKMSPNQMENFEKKLKKLRDVLKEVSDEVDPVEACQKLAKVFGDDFPIPLKKETAKSHSPAIVSSSNSA